MKRLVGFAVLVFAAVGAFALPGRDSVYVAAEVKAISTELGTRTLADLKVGELIPLYERLDVARQKDSSVWMASGLSFVWPGAGQFAAHDWFNGVLHTGFHVAITGASLVWAHSLLPSDLQWSNLDYFATRHDTVKARWGAHSVNDLLPAVGALALGGVADMALRVWSAHSAEETMKARIDDGTITFEPRFLGGGFGRGIGVGMGMGWRF